MSAEHTGDMPSIGTIAGQGPSLSDSSADKVLRLLAAFVGSPSRVTLTQLVTRTGLNKSTAHRLLATLVRQGYVRRVGDSYSLTHRVFEVGNHVVSCRPLGLREQAVPHLIDLLAETRQTVHLGVLQQCDVLYLEKLFGHGSARVATTVGTRRPSHATALGKVLLAYAPDTVRAQVLDRRLEQYTAQTKVDGRTLAGQLDQIRDTGCAIDCGEFVPDLSCVAAPVHLGGSGRVIAAISISVRGGAEVARRYRRAVMRTAHEISISRRLLAALEA